MTLTEERLRRRIRSAFHLDDPNLPPHIAQLAEEEVLDLIRTYGKAPKSQRERLYEDKEKKLLELLREGRKGRSAEHPSSRPA
jgi:hypothetical protein